MIEFLSEGTGKALGVKATGTLTSADLREGMIVEQVAARGGS
jgi:hypothetical protein